MWDGRLPPGVTAGALCPVVGGASAFFLMAIDSPSFRPSRWLACLLLSLSLPLLQGCGFLGYALPSETTNFHDPLWTPLGSGTYGAQGSSTLTPAVNFTEGGIVFGKQINPVSLQLSFTATILAPNASFADGFAVVLGDPSRGATITSLGDGGNNMGARGIPGMAFVFDDFQNPGDPATPYFGITPSDTALWEHPWLFTSGPLPPLASSGTSVSHAYLFTFGPGHLTVTMDGNTIFDGAVSLPASAYLYFTGSTGQYDQQVTISNVTANYSPAP